MSKVIDQTVVFKASAHEVYEALMDSTKHAAFTNSQAQISREVGGEFKAYDGYISGKNLELEPDIKIVQSWRAVDWPDDFLSQVIFQLTPVTGGTQLHFTHTGVPDGTQEEFTTGWIENYWEPMHSYLE
jgi:activator of HSP90 ATPase